MRRFTDFTFKNLKPKTARYEAPVDKQGLYASVQPSGAKRYVGRYRSPVTGKDTKISFEPAITLAAANKLWNDAKLEVAQGRDPHLEKQKKKQAEKATAEAGAPPELITLGTVITRYFRDPKVKELRSSQHSEAMALRNVLPVMGKRPIASIKRAELLALQSSLITERGPRTADMTMRILIRICHWWALQDPSEQFVTPFRKGMLTYKATEHERERSLSDNEIRLLWAATAECTVYSRLIRFLLCTGARRDEAAEMPRRGELQGDVWVLPPERNKVKKELKRPLSELALNILADLPAIEGNPYVFPGKDDGPFNHHSRAKAALDARLALLVQQERPADAPVPFAEKWQVHDLRRTARSLLSECGVNGDIAELCLGHLKKPIRRTYDRFEYAEEKRDAFEQLAARIRDIVQPPPANVAEFSKRKGKVA